MAVRWQALDALLQQSSRVLAQSHETVRAGQLKIKLAREHIAVCRRMKEDRIAVRQARWSAAARRESNESSDDA